jgi:hypothetical protein
VRSRSTWRAAVAAALAWAGVLGGSALSPVAAGTPPLPFVVPPHPPDHGTALGPPPPAACWFLTSYDGGNVNPPSLIYRGQVQCGSAIAPYTVRVHAQLLSNDDKTLVADGPSIGPVTISDHSVVTSQAALTTGTDLNPPIPGATYAVHTVESITFLPGDSWGPLPGCSLSADKQTMTCEVFWEFTYYPTSSGGSWVN